MYAHATLIAPFLTGSTASGSNYPDLAMTAVLFTCAGRRVDIGAFPWRWQGGEGCICRVVAFMET